MTPVEGTAPNCEKTSPSKSSRTENKLVPMKKNSRGKMAFSLLIPGRNPPAAAEYQV